ncbi:hypothetical protein X744_05680 [Mesorhizobium sp. LNJC372A00]|nr:hypothetical protein X752_09535 [Mesorhizobium sp. LNJC398B00]ESY37755.1 hypothetical protein X748_09405 [Mesorhizobium sp. LNJC386A00]ESY56619.1 hypothetical protein X745_06510 [Mesorhizobium sp. LNJC374B00]ESY61275.1 hypothetical protein X744_05680 [Mesorhizobium sp. LNJC372A00]ESZ63229.1 hypothetical protein X729_08025 [Mesorhizobium sp. L103C131B0]ESZ67232.1 hypothetical protein X728_00375 [Mesorhizobium sp. L103C120A0]
MLVGSGNISHQAKFGLAGLVVKEQHMKALTWHGKGDIRCEQVADPTIQDERDIAAESSERRYRPVIPSRWPQGRARTYKTFRDKEDGCIKVVMRPHG